MSESTIAPTPIKIEPSASEPKESNWLNNTIAILVALSAAFITIVNIKDNNIVQAMSQAQVHAVDSWSYYQAKSMKQHLTENSKELLSIQLDSTSNPEVRTKIETAIKAHETKVAKYEKEKEEIKTKAEGFQTEYDNLNIRDDQFDMSEALVSLALAVLGIAALIQNRWLVLGGFLMSFLGVVMGLAGFIGWNLHPEWLARLLG